MKTIKNVMEEKFERVIELVKEWTDLGLCSRNSLIDVNCRFDVKSKEWVVEVLGGAEYGETVEIALEKQIKVLESDSDYIEAVKREMVGDIRCSQ